MQMHMCNNALLHTLLRIVLWLQSTEVTNLFESSCVSLLHGTTLEGPLVNYQELPRVNIHGNAYRIPTS